VDRLVPPAERPRGCGNISTMNLSGRFDLACAATQRQSRRPGNDRRPYQVARRIRQGGGLVIPAVLAMAWSPFVQPSRVAAAQAIAPDPPPPLLRAPRAW